MKITKTLLSVAFILMLSSCAYQPTNIAHDPPGFFMGIIHGGIAPIALIVGFFSEVRIYSFPNSSWWYDLGFMLGISIWARAAVGVNKEG